MIGKTILKLRRKANLRQFELAEKVGISQNHLSQIETEKRKCSVELTVKIAAALGVAPAELLESGENSSIEVKHANNNAIGVGVGVGNNNVVHVPSDLNDDPITAMRRAIVLLESKELNKSSLQILKIMLESGIELLDKKLAKDT